MRGQRIFRKVIRRYGTWWDWRVMDESNALVDRGLSRRQEEAEKMARQAEKRALPEYRRIREALKKIPAQCRWACPE